MKYLAKDTNCAHCGGKLSPHSNGYGGIIIWCDNCGSNNPESPPNIDITTSHPTPAELPSERVLCACCGEPIHIDSFGAVKGQPEQWFHSKCWSFLNEELQRQRSQILAELNKPFQADQVTWNDRVYIDKEHTFNHFNKIRSALQPTKQQEDL